MTKSCVFEYFVVILSLMGARVSKLFRHLLRTRLNECYKYCCRFNTYRHYEYEKITHPYIDDSMCFTKH